MGIPERIVFDHHAGAHAPTRWASDASPPRSATAGTVVAVDIVEPHADLLVVDVTVQRL